jgi:hypothetical protein
MEYKVYATTYLKGKLMTKGAGWLRPEHELVDLTKELNRHAKANWTLSKINTTISGSKVIFTVVLQREAAPPEKDDNMPSPTN